MTKNESQEARRTMWILGSVLLLGLILRVCPLENLTRGSFEFGEGYLMANAAAPFSQIKNEILPEEAPLKYYFLHPLLYFGRSEFLVRLPALFFDLASILMLFFLGKLLFDKKTALLASFFLSISLWHIHHATMARNYPLYAFSVLASTFFLYRAAQGSGFRNWFFWGVAAAFGYYSFYPSVFILAAQLCWFFLYYGRRADLIKRLLLSLGLFSMMVAPSVSRLVVAFNRKANFRTGHWGLQGHEIWEALRDHFGGVAGPLPLGIFIFVLSLVWLIHFQKKKRQALLLLILIVVPICCYIFCVYVFRISVMPRQFLHIYPFFLLVAAAGIMSWPHWTARLSGIFVFVLPWLFYGFSLGGFKTSGFIPFDYRRHYVDFSAVRSLIEQNYNDLDFVVVDPWPPIFSIQYYFDKNNNSPVVIGEDAEERGELYAKYSNSRITLYGVSDNLSLLKDLAAAGRLLVIDASWVIKIKDRYENSDAITAWLKANAYRSEHKYSADFYFISPPPQISQGDKASLDNARQRLAQRLKTSNSLIYPFNRKKTNSL